MNVSLKLLLILFKISFVQAPIFVSRQIVLADAIKIGYGMRRTRNNKSIYDVSLDSAADGPDVLSEELDLVKNMNLAIREERYNDAGMIERCSPIYYLLHFTL
jgi:hypothetical protein